jgi:hypothetical protein
MVHRKADGEAEEKALILALVTEEGMQWSKAEQANVISLCEGLGRR